MFQAPPSHGLFHPSSGSHPYYRGEIPLFRPDHSPSHTVPIPDAGPISSFRIAPRPGSLTAMVEERVQVFRLCKVGSHSQSSSNSRRKGISAFSETVLSNAGISLVFPLKRALKSRPSRITSPGTEMPAREANVGYQSMAWATDTAYQSPPVCQVPAHRQYMEHATRLRTSSVWSHGSAAAVRPGQRPLSDTYITMVSSSIWRRSRVSMSRPT